METKIWQHESQGHMLEKYSKYGTVVLNEDGFNK